MEAGTYIPLLMMSCGTRLFDSSSSSIIVPVHRAAAVLSHSQHSTCLSLCSPRAQNAIWLPRTTPERRQEGTDWICLVGQVKKQPIMVSVKINRVSLPHSKIICKGTPQAPFQNLPRRANDTVVSSRAGLCSGHSSAQGQTPGEPH